jgi:tetratricopeptide (TPR) repeat protein
VTRSFSSKIEIDLGFRRILRVRWRRFAWLSGLFLLVTALGFGVTIMAQRWVRNSALEQAELSRKKKEVDLALRHLDRYLESHPEDVPVLEFKAKILSEVYLPWSQLSEAAKTLDLLIRLDPKGPGRLDTRRQLADFYIRYSEELKRFAELGNDPDIERKQSRFTSAVAVANQLVEDARKGNYKDPAAHRLLAKACEGQISELRNKPFRSTDASNGNVKDQEGEIEDLRLRAIRNYKTAINLDPQDLESPARLANLYLTWTKDQVTSDAILDGMLKANPNSVEARLIRYRVFSSSKRGALARGELEAILALAPDNVDVRIEIATSAMSRRDDAGEGRREARRQLDAIPKATQDDLRVKILRGYIDFAEQHPDEAIDQWRRGLMLVGGTSQDLTWKLAFNLIQLGRYDEAEPLRKQYMRLAKLDKNGMGKFLDALFDMGQGRLYEARRKLDRIKDVVPIAIRTDVLLSLGRCCDMIGDTESAMLAYRNASMTSPGSAGPRLSIARHLQKRNPEEAIREVTRALQDSPSESHLLLESIRLRLANPSFRSGPDPKQLKEIEDLIARAEAVTTSNPSLLVYRADFLAVTGQLPKAVDLLTQAVQGDYRKIPEIWISLSQGLERLNRRNNEGVQALERASAPENVGDRVSLRIAKARLLVRAGKGQAAREALSKDREAVSAVERPQLAQALGELLRELGDRDGALAAYAEWAELAPTIPGPALALLSIAQVDNDDRAAKLGLEALKRIGGDREPYGIAARALELMRKDPNRPGPPPPDKLYEADILIKTLREEVPSLRFGSLLEGVIREYQGNLEEAVKSYKVAQKDDINSPALPRLIEAYLKLKRFAELDGLRQEFDREIEARQQPGLAAEFDKVAAAAARKLGDRDRAEYYASRAIEGRRDNISAQARLSWALDPKRDPNQVEDLLKAEVKENPKDPARWFILIGFQANRKTLADVARTIGQARRECQSDRPELFLAQCYLIGKDLPNAKLSFDKAVELRPDDVITLRALVDFYEGTNRGELADPVLRKVLKVDPTASWAARQLALRLTTRTDTVAWQEAWSLISPGSSASGETPEDRLVRATVLARSPDISRRREAIPAFTALANDLPVLSPLAVDTRLRLSQAMIDMNQFGEAWTAIRPIADDLSRPNQAALVLAVESLARSKRPDEAEIRLERLASLDPKSPQIRLSKSWISLARGNKAEAIASLEAAFKESSGSPNAELVAKIALELMIKTGDVETSLILAKEMAERWPADAWLLAWVHELRKEYDQALAVLERGLEAGMPAESIRFAMMAGNARRDDPKFLRRVVALGEKARAKAPKDPNVRVSLASIYHLEGRYQEELDCYREALELSPTNVHFLNNMAWTLCEGLQRPQEAIKYIEEAIRRDGEVAQYLDTRGVIEERLGQVSRAIEDLEKAVKVDPSYTTYFHLARAYSRAKDTASSRRNRDLANKAGFDSKNLDPTDRWDLDAVMEKP